MKSEPLLSQLETEDSKYMHCNVILSYEQRTASVFSFIFYIFEVKINSIIVSSYTDWFTHFRCDRYFRCGGQFVPVFTEARYHEEYGGVEVQTLTFLSIEASGEHYALIAPCTNWLGIRARLFVTTLNSFAPPVIVPRSSSLRPLCNSSAELAEYNVNRIGRSGRFLCSITLLCRWGGGGLFYLAWT